MSLSTSSSKQYQAYEQAVVQPIPSERPRTARSVRVRLAVPRVFNSELKVLGVMLLLLLGSEFVMRKFGGRLSRDLQHIGNIPQLSQKLASQPGYRILFLGNSATHEGVVVNLLKPQLEPYLKRPLEIERVFPDDTTVAEWYYLFKHHFADAGRLPDLLVLNFVFNYQVRDRDTIKTEAIAAYYSGLADIPEVFAADVPDFERRAGFLVAKFSAAAANRERVRARLLDQFIPHYRTSTRKMNESRKLAQQTPPLTGPAVSYSRLQHLLTLARTAGVQVLVVAMPTNGGYQLDPQIQTTIELSGGRLLDLRSVVGLQPTHYADELHLNPAGARVYSQFLAGQLRQYLPAAELLSQQQHPSKR